MVFINNLGILRLKTTAAHSRCRKNTKKQYYEESVAVPKNHNRIPAFKHTLQINNRSKPATRGKTPDFHEKMIQGFSLVLVGVYP